MPSYYLNEAMLELPDLGFEDRTLHMLRAASPSGQGDLDLVIRRSPIPRDRTILDLIREHVEGESRSLLRYAVLEEREVSVDGAQALDVASRWAAASGPVYQRQAHLASGDLWLMFLMIAPMADRATCDEAFDAMLASVRLRDGR